MCVHLATECVQPWTEAHVLCATQRPHSHPYQVLPRAPASLFPLSPSFSGTRDVLMPNRASLPFLFSLSRQTLAHLLRLDILQGASCDNPAYQCC